MLENVCMGSTAVLNACKCKHLYNEERRLHASSYIGNCVAVTQLSGWLRLMLPAAACSSRREVRATALAVLQWRAASLPNLEVELCHNMRLLRELLGGTDEGVQANALAILATLLPKLRGHIVGGVGPWGFPSDQDVQLLNLQHKLAFLLPLFFFLHY